MADTSVKVSFIGDAKKLSKTIDGVDKEIDGLGKKSQSFGAKFTDGFQKALPVLAGVGAGVAVIGSALKAAAEDEAQQKQLATTLMNVVSATNEQIAATEKTIDLWQRQSGIADSELRPALANLVRGTKDLEVSQELLGLAMDVSVGTGKDLESVTQALSMAYNGNMKALRALDPSLTELIKDGAEVKDVFGALNVTFGGQSAEAAETFDGKMKRLKISLDELQEKLGGALLPYAVQLGDWLIGTGIPKAEEFAGKVKVWWGEQEELKNQIKESIQQAVDFGEALIPMGEKAWDAYLKVKPLVDAMVRLQQISSGVQAFGGGGRSIEDIIRERQATTNFTSAGGGVGSAPGRASGGPVMAGQQYTVGERGPETFVPGRSGSIVPNGGGMAQVINLNIDGRSFMSWMADYSRDAGGIPITLRSPS